jgi:hypothetical protein
MAKPKQSKVREDGEDLPSPAVARPNPGPKGSPNYDGVGFGAPPSGTWDQRRDAGFEKSSKK